MMAQSRPQFDILIIGSGPSGSHAALEAASTGHKVALLDIGYSASGPAELIPNLPFSEIRATDPNQNRYFLGDDPITVLRNQDRGGTHLTPARQYMIRDMEKLFPLESTSFAPLQSTGAGGLGISWGANCVALEDFELKKIGIPDGALRSYYAKVAREIGISGAADDLLAPFIANIDPGVIQPPLPMDTNAATLLRSYQAKQNKHIRRGFYLGRSLLAMLSQAKDDRQVNPQFDMDFWTDAGRSVYRPQYSIEKLEKMPNVTRLSGRLAVRLQDDAEGASVNCIRLDMNSGETFSARKILLAAGAINSGRLALASFGGDDRKLPILCNPNHWVACINLAMLGKPARDSRHSLAQLTLLMKTELEGPDYLLAHIYSYRSLLWFRLLKNIPLPPKLALRFLRLVGTAFTCVNIHFPDHPSAGRWIKVKNSGGRSVVQAECEFSAAEKEWVIRNERRLLLFLTSLGCLPLGTTRPLHGASIHYAGTLPYSEEDEPFTTHISGRLHGTHNIYIADGSNWRFLPAKGLTLTLMANARRIAAHAVRELSKSPAAEQPAQTIS